MKGLCDDHLFKPYYTIDIYHDYVYLGVDESDDSDDSVLMIKFKIF